MAPKPPDLPVNEPVDDLTDYWRQLNKEIARIELRYPFIVTTIVTLFVGLVAARNTVWFRALQPLAPYLVPAMVLLGLSYVLTLFRQVALLRGYSAFVEDEINQRLSSKVYLWNSQYVDRFEQNNEPNVLMMILNLILVGICIWGMGMYISSQGL